MGESRDEIGKKLPENEDKYIFKGPVSVRPACVNYISDTMFHYRNV